MAELFMMPKYGQTMEEGTVVSWRKKEGDTIAKGDVLLEVETDKALMEVESEHEGVILRILAAEGQTLKCGEPLVWIGEPGETVPAA